jgi:cob(I)alamin adenosyltransferase
MARALTRHEAIQTILRCIQEDIIVASAELASSPEAALQLERRIDKGDVVRLESWIDQLTASFNLPNRFVRPGVSPDSAAVHLARVVCRRCERLIVMLNRQAGGYDDLLIYFNRLSDLLFVIAWCLELTVIVEDTIMGLATRAPEKGSGR